MSARWARSPGGGRTPGDKCARWAPGGLCARWARWLHRQVDEVLFDTVGVAVRPERMSAARSPGRNLKKHNARWAMKLSQQIEGNMCVGGARSPGGPGGLFARWARWARQVAARWLPSGQTTIILFAEIAYENDGDVFGPVLGACLLRFVLCIFEKE